MTAEAVLGVEGFTDPALQFAFSSNAVLPARVSESGDALLTTVAVRAALKSPNVMSHGILLCTHVYRCVCACAPGCVYLRLCPALSVDFSLP